MGVADSALETARLEILQMLEILDTAAEPAFDVLVRIASRVCGCPISLMSLVDADRQWFKSKVGIDARETPRSQAFCAHAIRENVLFEIPDATADARFADNPLVTGDPQIRFYAGQPILFDGVALGTLCVIDRVPRTLDAGQRDQMRELSIVLADLLHGRMQALLHRREAQRLNDFAQLSGDWLWESDILHRRTWFSGDATKTGGLFYPSLLGDRFRDLAVLDWAGRATDGPDLLGLLDRCEPFSNVVVEMTQGGDRRFVSLTAVPMQGVRGEPTGFRGSAKDVTERIDAELQLRAQERALVTSERRIRDVTDNMPAMISRVDRDERYTFANAAIGKVLGIDPASLVGRSMREVRDQQRYDHSKPHIDRALSGQRTTFEGTSELNGRTYHYQSTYIPDVDVDGEVTGFYAMTFDLTQRKNAELRQVESEKLLRGITDNLPALVCYVGTDDLYRFANGTYGDWLGLDHRAMVGRSYRDFVDAEALALMLPFVERARSGERVAFERPVRVHGVERRLFVEYVPDFDAHDVVTGLFSMTTDITERRLAEQRLVESEQRLLDITNHMPALIGQFDMDGRSVFANDVSLREYGLTCDDVPTLTFRSQIGEVLYTRHEATIDAALAGRAGVVHGQRDRDGRTRFFEAHLIPQVDRAGVQRGFYVMSFDVTSLKTAQAERERSEARLRQITDALPVLITYIDADERMTYMNETFRQWLGGKAADIIGHTVLDAVGPVLYAQRKGYIDRCLAGETVHFEMESVTHGALRNLQTSYLPDVGSDGRVVGITTMSLDVTDMKAAERRLSELAHRDALTGLPNRLTFNEHLEAALADRSPAPGRLALMFLDVDRFKGVNDRHGHAVGDAVLIEFARRLRDCVQPTDLVARLAGDEFVVLLRDLVDATDAEQVARDVIDRLSPAFAVGGESLAVTASIGIAWCDERIVGPADLLAKADDALYFAKESGRNTYRFKR